jgi:hypothetical protein
MPLTCPTCGNSSHFLVKTAQIHVVEFKGERIDVAEESRPTIFEVLCDRCDAALDVDACDEPTRRELLLALGAE